MFEGFLKLKHFCVVFIVLCSIATFKSGLAMGDSDECQICAEKFGFFTHQRIALHKDAATDELKHYVCADCFEHGCLVQDRNQGIHDKILCPFCKGKVHPSSLTQCQKIAQSARQNSYSIYFGALSGIFSHLLIGRTYASSGGKRFGWSFLMVVKFCLDGVGIIAKVGEHTSDNSPAYFYAGSQLATIVALPLARRLLFSTKVLNALRNASHFLKKGGGLLTPLENPARTNNPLLLTAVSTQPLRV
ncbi:TPA: hypothetical protein DDZ86_03660 [Candidatus Dependentiae bacterium]|nr:MAG: hypothetical protein UW09_C0003G0084 [candidate division TM6 bacterium GW2011_GWF2_43_87]HBL98712.1 hypothetical protein [Candidatus Dependentiae bacterium]